LGILDVSIVKNLIFLTNNSMNCQCISLWKQSILVFKSMTKSEKENKFLILICVSDVGLLKFDRISQVILARSLDISGSTTDFRVLQKNNFQQQQTTTTLYWFNLKIKLCKMVDAKNMTTSEIHNEMNLITLRLLNLSQELVNAKLRLEEFTKQVKITFN
jgi:hypothetical protein